MSTETLSRLYLELGQLLPKSTVTAREMKLLHALARCVNCIESSDSYRIGNPAFEQAHAEAVKLIREYGDLASMP